MAWTLKKIQRGTEWCTFQFPHTCKISIIDCLKRLNFVILFLSHFGDKRQNFLSNRKAAGTDERLDMQSYYFWRDTFLRGECESGNAAAVISVVTSLPSRYCIRCVHWDAKTDPTKGCRNFSVCTVYLSRLFNLMLLLFLAKFSLRSIFPCYHHNNSWYGQLGSP